MLAEPPPDFLLASPDPAILTLLEPVLHSAGARVEIVLTAEAALASLTAHNPPTLALLDVGLTGAEPGSGINDLLLAVRTQVSRRRLSIILIADSVTAEAVGYLAAGLIDDLIPRTADVPYWRLRIELVLSTLHKLHELEALRETARQNAQMDHLTGIYNRETLMAVLFRETDRVQRMKTSLATILFDIDDFGHWNSRLGAEACDDLLRQVTARTNRLLRSYDLFGRIGKDEFLVGLPGCNPANAAMMAERLRLEVFFTPFEVAGQSIRLTACFGITTSLGRSPIVVLREAEQALQSARATGPETIQSFDECPASAAGAEISIPLTGDSASNDLLAW